LVFIAPSSRSRGTVATAVQPPGLPEARKIRAKAL
jgi:hypothetical protein